MELNVAADRLSALAQPNRLAVFRLLVSAGKGGVAAGEIASALAIPPSTLSAQLSVLSRAGLIDQERRGRSLVYRANFKIMGDLMVYLVEDCCQGRPELCAQIAEGSARLMSCADESEC